MNEHLHHALLILGVGLALLGLLMFFSTGGDE